jgi:hypothetical protein
MGNRVNIGLFLVLAIVLAVYFIFIHKSKPKPPPTTGLKPTLPDWKIFELAERIWAAAWEGWILFEDENAIIRAFSELGNDEDYRLLNIAYGERRGPLAIDKVQNLSQVIQDLFNDSEKAELNNLLKSKGMQTRF